jgi:hypothetical protein
MTDAFPASALMREIVSHLNESLPASLSAPPINAKARRLGPGSFGVKSEAPFLGVYLYRMRTDRHASSAATPSNRPALFLSLHFLLVATADDPDVEAMLMCWGIAELACMPVVSIAGGETARIFQEDLTTESLMQIWAALRAEYRLATPYVANGVALSL